MKLRLLILETPQARARHNGAIFWVPGNYPGTRAVVLQQRDGDEWLDVPVVHERELDDA